MKAFFKLISLVVFVGILASCGGAADTDSGDMTAAEQWAQANQLGPWQPAEEDWAAIEAAAIEEGIVVVYSNSSKISDLVEAWNALYPEIELGGGETEGIDTKMSAEQEAENVVGDVWFNSDGHILYGRFYANQWLWPYVPRGVVIPEVTADFPFGVARHSTDVIGYNTAFNPDGCPITNIWQLTEPAYENKFFMEDPISDVSTMAKIATFVQNADEMAQAYEDLYGRDWSEDELAAPDANGITVDNAGYLFLKKLAYNGVITYNDGDEVDNAYASLTMPEGEEPGLGWSGYSSYGDALDGELNMAPCFGLEPIMGIFKTSFVGIATNAPHPNAAKLFIRFLLTQEGYEPWNKLGTYPAVEGLEYNEDNLPLEELMPQVWEMDPVFDWENVSVVRDFWAASLLTAP